MSVGKNSCVQMSWGQMSLGANFTNIGAHVLLSTSDNGGAFLSLRYGYLVLLEVNTVFYLC